MKNRTETLTNSKVAKKNHTSMWRSIYLSSYAHMKKILKGNPCLLLQIEFTVQGREVVIPLGHDAGDERENSTCRTTQHVLLRKMKA